MRSSRRVPDNYTGPDAAKIRMMFASIAARYDRANTILSAGVHHRWRRRAVSRANAKKGDEVLDCATGTGDLAIAFRRAVGATGRVVGTDFSPEMLELARAKAPDIAFGPADVMALPYADSTFDIVSIAFGIRNVAEPRRAIAEMGRVARPGGRVVVLEFGQPRSRAFAALYNFYRRRILPHVGAAITGQRSAYDYLETSAARFPSGDDFVNLMRDSAPFVEVMSEPLTLGIAWLYVGVTGASTRR
jgi:demethylmenaquinone methyltransferase / 2-methoxy-6-polyprenyl-1,4-benzoquinol methylase